MSGKATTIFVSCFLAIQGGCRTWLEGACDDSGTTVSTAHRALRADNETCPAVPSAGPPISGPEVIVRPPLVAREAEVSYPCGPLRKAVTGDAVLLVSINEEGSVVQATLVNSSGSAVLDRAALAAIVEFKFLPACTNFGRAAPVRIRYTFTFRLR